MLKRNPSLTEQVKQHLKQRIINAEFSEGRIPSENHLASELGVSRNTIRDALSRLEMEGVIFRRQGAGTFINEAVLLVKTRLEEIVPYSQLIAEHGYTPTVHLLSAIEEAAEPKTAELLNMAAGEPVLTVQKLFRADDTPVILTTTHIPTHLIQQPYSNDLFLDPTFRFLPELCRQTLAYFITDIVPCLASDRLAAQLSLTRPHTALLSFEEIGYNQDNQPLLKAVSYFRDDLLRLRLIRRQRQPLAP